MDATNIHVYCDSKPNSAYLPMKHIALLHVEPSIWTITKQIYAIFLAKPVQKKKKKKKKKLK
jgi:hypothetical protein